ncbi:MAG: VWA domain-containing protein [Bacteroidales bacterium]|nr:VWA domain-containing protein [Bacteroidales bacterium]MCD8388006.1 VWA domain-containing protein [Bacteroidales bacterium]
MQFAQPSYLWLFLIYVPLIAWYVLKQGNARATLGISTISPFATIGRSWKEYLRHALFLLRLGAIGALIIVLARPQTRDSWHTTSTEGTDIMIALDVSTSMLAMDFEPDRLEAAKAVAADFVQGRESDNIGVVIFAGESLTGMPMTVDRGMLINYINSIDMNVLPDGTAIGDGIATALNRLKEGKAKSRSIILLTDGSNNTGVVAPLTAAEVAKELDARIYTIGIGTNGTANYPVMTAFGKQIQQMPVVIDENTLKQIADLTGGKYFRATNNNVLREVFDEIDTLEKTRMDVRHFSHAEDNYMLWAWLAFGLFALELLLRYTILRSIP